MSFLGRPLRPPKAYAFFAARIAARTDKVIANVDAESSLGARHFLQTNDQELSRLHVRNAREIALHVLKESVASRNCPGGKLSSQDLNVTSCAQENLVRGDKGSRFHGGIDALGEQRKSGWRSLEALTPCVKSAGNFKRVLFCMNSSDPGATKRRTSSSGDFTG